jgi:hypothetical protein
MIIDTSAFLIRRTASWLLALTISREAWLTGKNLSVTSEAAEAPSVRISTFGKIYLSAEKL